MNLGRQALFWTGVILIQSFALGLVHADPTPWETPVEYALPPTPEVSQALFKMWKPDNPRGVLVLVTGHKDKIPKLSEKARNEELQEVNGWVNFAVQHQLGCVWISVVAPAVRLNVGGGYDAPGMADLILKNGLRKLSLDNLPVYVCGRNPDAGRFVISLIDSSPDLIKGWCCTGGDNWPKSANPNLTIPGILVGLL